MHLALVALISIIATLSAAVFVAPAPAVAPQVATQESAQPPATIAATNEPADTTPAPTTDAAVPQTEAAAPVAPAPTPTPEPEPTPAAQSGLAEADLNAAARASLVNIFCTTRSGGETKPLSGSGVIIDSRGVVLTNAHIAQYFLLRDYPTKNNIDCVLRMGSPAVAKYRASLLYIPTEWVEDNAKKIDDKTAKGTGENDFALLVINDALNGSLPAAYPAITPKSTAPAVGERMLVAAYPAGFLSGETIAESLYPTSAFVSIVKKYTFEDPQNTDLFSVGGSVVTQSGSSGGAAVRTDGTLAGLISTALLSGTTEERELRAITVAHINRSLAAAGKGSLTDLLSGTVASKALTFEEDVAPELTELLETALKN